MSLPATTGNKPALGFFQALPSIRNREGYARMGESIANVRELQEIAEGVSPGDALILGGFCDGMKSGLRFQKVSDGIETTGLLLSQIGGIAFFPTLFLSSAVPFLAASGALIAGIGLYSLSRLFLQEKAFALSIPGAGNVPGTLQKYDRIRRDMKEKERLIADKTESFRKSFEKIGEDADSQAILVEDNRVTIGGVTLRIKESGRYPAFFHTLLSPGNHALASLTKRARSLSQKSPPSTKSEVRKTMSDAMLT